MRINGTMPACAMPEDLSMNTLAQDLRYAFRSLSVIPPSPRWRSARWPSASARTRLSLRWSNRCCCDRCLTTNRRGCTPSAPRPRSPSPFVGGPCPTSSIHRLPVRHHRVPATGRVQRLELERHGCRRSRGHSRRGGDHQLLRYTRRSAATGTRLSAGRGVAWPRQSRGPQRCFLAQTFPGRSRYAGQIDSARR